MSEVVWLACGRCGRMCAPGPAFFGCPSCRQGGEVSVLEVEYAPAARPGCPPFGDGERSSGIWSYAALLPVQDAASRVSIGEGHTPLLPSGKVGPRIGLSRLYYKNETANPTWSFKDRYAAVTVSMAKSLGFKRIIASSTGNHGTAVAAYAAAGGLTCVVLCSPGAPAVMLEQMRAYAAVPIVITGGDRFSLVERLAVEHGWFPASLFLPTPVHNPYGIEGYKTLAYEIVRDLGACPAAVVFPCARGNGLYGAWKGFRDLRRLGLIDRLPRMIACQPLAANTLERSLRAGHIVRIPAPRSIAASITEEVAAPQALEAIQTSGGDAIAVPDAEAVEMARQLAAEGLWVETSSALAVAGLTTLRERRVLTPDDAIVVVLTGAGVKWTSNTAAMADVPRIEGSARQLEDCLAREGIAL